MRPLGRNIRWDLGQSHPWVISADLVNIQESHRTVCDRLRGEQGLSGVRGTKPKKHSEF